MLTIEHLKKSFGEKEILDDISLEVDNGEIVTIIGPSGTGKTTLLRCINFLEHAERGRITIDDASADCAHAPHRDILRLVRKSGMVFQTYNLFRNKTVTENVTEGLTVVKKMSKKEALEIARVELDKVGMTEWKDSYPSQISGGQQQRVAIARALAMGPSILLLDEPTSALDPELSKEVLNTVRKVAGEGISMLIVTHEIEFAREISNRIIFMENGKIVEQGPPKDIFTFPKEERTKSFIQRLYPMDYQI
ncbi:MAG: amino acid ABC transporter ATP-binding protein [Butyrivibrio sp.]|nr:amino acid ABC transporter ATP-binding protein [Butyrivibrio sp.]